MPQPFSTNVDIGNRGLQHCGASMITSFTDGSRNAAQVAFVYDKLRVAELRRNVWRFAIRKAILRPIDVTTMILSPVAWTSSGVTYIFGSLVSYSSILYYYSNATLDNATTPDLNPAWEQYFGPMTVSMWDQSGATPAAWNNTTTYAANISVLGSDGNIYVSLENGNVGIDPTTDGGVHWFQEGPPNTGTAYYGGEVVYVPTGVDGGYSLYLSLENGNTDDPSVVKSWSATTTYNKNQTVTYSSTVWQSTVPLNLNNAPGTFGWIAVPGTQSDVMQGQNWLKLNVGSTLSALTLIYPLGTGPLSQQNTRNIFMLPNGYLRKAPLDPKAGATSWLGSPMGQLFYDDWLFEGNYITSSTPTPLMLRFVADISDVTLMDPMFCEGLGARVAIEVCEVLTQSDGKLASIGSAYKEFMAEARTVNGIETGAEMPPLDDWLACRV